MDTFAKEFEGIENKTKEDLHDLQLDPDGKFKTVTKDKNKKICAINENKMEALRLNENGTFKSIICPICKKIPTKQVGYMSYKKPYDFTTRTFTFFCFIIYFIGLFLFLFLFDLLKHIFSFFY